MNTGTLLHNLIIGAPELMIKMCFLALFATYDVRENRIKISLMILSPSFSFCKPVVAWGKEIGNII